MTAMATTTDAAAVARFTDPPPSIAHDMVDTPIGTFLLMGSGDILVGARLPHRWSSADVPGGCPRDATALRGPAEQLMEYFAGKRDGFDVRYAPTGTPFQLRVWAALCDVPFGTTATYRDIARAVGNERATRAVGLANNRNPIALFVPCHRIVGANGSLTGYGGGLEMKAWLLDHERAAAS